MNQPFKKELETYQENLPSLLGDAGKFVVIQGTVLLGVFSTYDDALAEAYKAYGETPFLIKQIQVDETIHCFTRDLVACLS